MSIALEPVKPRKSLAEKRDELAREAAAPIAENPASAFAAALVAALREEGGGKSPAKIRYGEDNKSEVIVRANRQVHISPADLALSQIHGNAYGVDGPSRKFEEGAIIVMREGPGLQSMLAQGKVRIDPQHPQAAR